MAVSFKDIVAQVKENADIVQVIGQYIQLKKVGSRYLGLCPFHHDRSPSLNVTPQMGIYKCFACGAGGDVLKFVQEYEKLDFLDALKTVAVKAGIAVPETFAKDKEGRDQREKGSQALAANQLACRFYQEQLEANPEVLKYLLDRGITPETRKHFQLGWSPNSPDKLLRLAESKGVSVRAFIEAGILGESGGGRIYDRFQERLIFPIWNMSGHVIGFGARTLSSAAGIPKYVNSPESPFYHKSKVLYGINFARNAMDKSGEAVIVEGYMDLLALWQAGIRNAVAVSGTALTQEHVHILSRFVRKAFLFFDGDEAGRKAVRRSLEPMLAMGLEVKVPVLPASEDPDSFSRKFGAEALAALFRDGDNVVGFLLRSQGRHPDSMSPEEKHAFIRECHLVLNHIPAASVRKEYVDKLGQKLGLQAIQAGAWVAAAAASPQASGSMRVAEGGPATRVSVPGSAPERRLLELLLSSHALCLSALESLELEWIQTEAARDLIDHLLAFVEETGELHLLRFLEKLSAEDQAVVSAIRLSEGQDPDILKKEFSQTLSALRLRHLQKRMHANADLATQNEYLTHVRELQFSKSKGGSP